MSHLIIEHVQHTDPPQFRARRVNPDKAGEPVSIPSPHVFPVQGQTDESGQARLLMAELRWYLEHFLDYPFHPHTERAEQIEAAIQEWGTTAFTALFDSGKGSQFYYDVVKDLEDLRLEIVSDDPRILAWPWEALFDPERHYLAHQCRIARRLHRVADPAPVPDQLPKDRVNILLVVARPMENDVAFRSLSRPLVELIHSENLPAQVTVLRPPTLANLDRHLHDHPGTYHLVHFDGHGGYGWNVNAGFDTENAAANVGTKSAKASVCTPFVYQGPQGHLLFEGEDGGEDRVPAHKLAALLREYKIPIVVMNACQSAMIDAQADNAFASVAASLLQAGVRSVVVMAYSLYVSGAREFIPEFYRGLFQSGQAVEGLRAGRRRMLHADGRICARGTFPLQDWLVPVIYEQEPLDFDFSTSADAKFSTENTAFDRLPLEAADSENPYGLIGRDRAMLALERAWQRPPGSILIQGMGGIGKTTLARGFVHWLAQTNGLGHGCFWFTFNDIHTGEHVLNQMGLALAGPEFNLLPVEQKLAGLCDVFKRERFVIVWDNFESAAGIEGTGVSGLLSPDDRGLLRRFLAGIRGGKTKVLITSRSRETWLGHTNCYELRLGGLYGEERWDFCQAILHDLGLKADQKDPELTDLLEQLDGHPLAMRAVLPLLRGHSPARLKQAVQTNLAGLHLPPDDPANRHLTAILQFIEQSLPDELRPLLYPLALHERFVDADYLKYMAQGVPTLALASEDQEQVKASTPSADTPSFDAPVIHRFLDTLTAAGLLHHHGQGIYGIHPALTGYLRSGVPKFTLKEDQERVKASVDTPEITELWQRAFVNLMGSLADHYTPKERHEQRPVFHLHLANFHHALQLAEQLDMGDDYAALTQSLAAWAQNNRHWSDAERLFQDLVKFEQKRENLEGEAAAYHQLGMIAEERRDFSTAEQWYLKSLAISEKQGNEHDAASTYHQLGMIAQERRDFARAEQWYLKALPIWERLDIQHHAASTYHQLGYIAQDRRDFATAEQWYLKSLAISEKQGNEHGAATTYHQLGRIAQERRDFATAEQWYLKSLAIKEKQGNEHGAATTYHQLGMIAEERRDFATAEQWYLKSLAIEEKQGNEHGAAGTYHQLGRIAQERRDFATAEQWYLKSLAISEKQGNEHGAATTYHQLGRIAEERRDFATAEQWYLKALAIDEKQGNEHGAAITYHQLGRVAAERRDFVSAEQWCLKSLAIKEKQGNEFGEAFSYAQLGVLSIQKDEFREAGNWLLKAATIFANTKDFQNLQVILNNIELLLKIAAPTDIEYIDSLINNGGFKPLLQSSSSTKSLKILNEQRDEYRDEDRTITLIVEKPSGAIQEILNKEGANQESEDETLRWFNSTVKDFEEAAEWHNLIGFLNRTIINYKNNAMIQGLAFFELAKIYHKKILDIGLAVTNYRDSIMMFEDINNKEYSAYARVGLALIETKLGEVKDALANLSYAKAVFEELGLKEDLVKLNNFINSIS